MAAQETQVGVGATVTAYEIQLADEEPESFLVPALNFWTRYGLSDRVELHGRAWLPLGATIGTKVQLLGDRTEAGFGLSTGLDVGYLRFTSGNSSSTVIDTYVPLYTGYRFSEGFTTYLSPKYLLRAQTGGDRVALAHSVGGTLGLAAGKKSKLYLEGTGVYDITNRGLSWTGGIGVGF